MSLAHTTYIIQSGQVVSRGDEEGLVDPRVVEVVRGGGKKGGQSVKRRETGGHARLL